MCISSSITVSYENYFHFKMHNAKSTVMTHRYSLSHSFAVYLFSSFCMCGMASYSV